jgi:dolichyl-phosphate-mannose--protein O-mannosyl transferase
MSIDPFRGLSRKQNLIYLAIFAFAIFLRTYNIKQPDSLNFDEAHYVPAARILVGLAPHPGMEDWKYIPTLYKTPDINFSHPPLGKYLIGWGMRLVGDNPLGWRIAASLFGVLGLLLFMVVAHVISQDFRFTALATFLLCIDFMHVVQSRIGMLDIFMLFWVQLAMLGSALIAFSPNRLWLGVVLSAIGIGVGIATKVPAATAALACVLVVVWCTQFSWKAKAQIIGIAAAFSVAIYALWFFYYAYHGYTFSEWIQFHYDVVRHVAGPLSQHRYGSHPGQWLLNAKPVWYYFKHIEQYRYGIIGLGNPVVWLALIPAMIIVGGHARYRLAKRDLFLVIWVLSTYLPLIYMLWNRQGFLYHMFLVSPAIVLIVSRAAVLEGRWKAPLVVAGAAALALVAFAPIVLCLPMPDGWYLWITKMVGV